MRTCPSCCKVFDDQISFCLDDGSPLSEPGPAAPYSQAVAFGSLPAQTQDQRSYLLLVVAGLLFVVVLLLVGMVGTAWYFISAVRRDTAAVNRIGQAPGNAPPTNRLGNLIDVSNTSPNGKPNFNSINERLANLRGSNTSQTGDNTKSNPPKTISGGVLNGKATYLPKPPYPAAARAVRATGSVAVQVLIDKDGNVVSASAVSGHPLLRAAAESAAREAKFSPTLISGQPVTVSGIIAYNFVP